VFYINSSLFAIPYKNTKIQLTCQASRHDQRKEKYDKCSFHVEECLVLLLPIGLENNRISCWLLSNVSFI